MMKAETLRLVYNGNIFELRKNSCAPAMIRTKKIGAVRYETCAETTKDVVIALAQKLRRHGAIIRHGYFLDFIEA